MMVRYTVWCFFVLLSCSPFTFSLSLSLSLNFFLSPNLAIFKIAKDPVWRLSNLFSHARKKTTIRGKSNSFCFWKTHEATRTNFYSPCSFSFFLFLFFFYNKLLRATVFVFQFFFVCRSDIKLNTYSNFFFLSFSATT